METLDKEVLLPVESILQRILVIRQQKIMLSTDLAPLYGVEPKVLVQAVKRNLNRFPPDFMFQLTNEEFEQVLKSQFVTSKEERRGGIHRATPYAFTEQGVAMLSSILRSEQAVQTNIAIMRAFVQLRRTMATHVELVQKLEELENRITEHDHHILALFEAIRELMMPSDVTNRRIGFREDRESSEQDQTE